MNSALQVLAAGAQLRQHDVNTLLVDETQSGVGQPQADPALFAFDPEAAPLQVRQKTALGFVIGVRNVVAHHRGLTGNLADSSHDSSLNIATACLVPGYGIGRSSTRSEEHTSELQSHSEIVC